MKLAITVAFFIALQAMTPIPRQAIRGHADKAETKTQVPKDGQQSTPALAPDIAVNPSAKEYSATKSTDGETQNTKQGTQKYEAWSRADKFSLAYDILTALLVIIGGFGVCFALRTLRAIERQTALQAAALRQWVTIQGFREAVEPRFTPNTAPELELQLSFEIANPTKMPLTLEWYVISINTTKYSSRLNFTLAPGQVHGVKVLISYTDEVKNKYLREGYVITITGVIAYIDALKEFQKQRFGHLYRCGPGHREILNYQGPLPDEDIEKDQSKGG